MNYKSKWKVKIEGIIYFSGDDFYIHCKADDNI